MVTQIPPHGRRGLQNSMSCASSILHFDKDTFSITELCALSARVEQLACVNRPIVHHLGLSRHCLWRAAKAQARRPTPRPRPVRPSPSLALLLAAGLPLAWTESQYTCVQLRASISGYVSRATSPTLHSSPPPTPRGMLSTTAPHLAPVLPCRPRHSPHERSSPACARARPRTARRIARQRPACMQAP